MSSTGNVNQPIQGASNDIGNFPRAAGNQQNSTIDNRIRGVQEKYKQEVETLNQSRPKLDWHQSKLTIKGTDLLESKELDGAVRGLNTINPLKELGTPEELRQWVDHAEKQVKFAEAILATSKNWIVSKLTLGISNKLWNVASGGKETQLLEAIQGYKSYIQQVKDQGIEAFKAIRILDTERTIENRVNEIEVEINQLENLRNEAQKNYRDPEARKEEARMTNELRALGKELKVKISELSDESPLNEKACDLFFKCQDLTFNRTAKAVSNLRDSYYGVSESTKNILPIKYEKSLVKILTEDIKKIRAYVAHAKFLRKEFEKVEMLNLLKSSSPFELRTANPPLNLNAQDFPELKAFAGNTSFVSDEFKAFVKLTQFDQSTLSDITEDDLSDIDKQFMADENVYIAKQNEAVKRLTEQIKTGTFDLNNSQEVIDVLNRSIGKAVYELSFKNSSHITRRLANAEAYAQIYAALALNPKCHQLLEEINKNFRGDPGTIGISVEMHEELNAALFKEFDKVRPASALTQLRIRSSKNDNSAHLYMYNLLQLYPVNSNIQLESERNTLDMLLKYLKNGQLQVSPFVYLVKNEAPSFKKEMNEKAIIYRNALADGRVKTENEAEKVAYEKTITLFGALANDTLLIKDAEITLSNMIKNNEKIDEEWLKKVFSGLLLGGFSAEDNQAILPDYKAFININILLAQNPQYNKLQENLYSYLSTQVYPVANAKEFNKAVVERIKNENKDIYSKVIKTRVAIKNWNEQNQLNNFLEIMPLGDDPIGFDRSEKTAILMLQMLRSKLITIDEFDKMFRFDLKFNEKMKDVMRENELNILHRSNAYSQEVKDSFNKAFKVLKSYYQI